MSSNDSTILDSEGNSSDWLELHNGTKSSINLNGYFLSDDLEQPQKWVFPEIMLMPDSFLLVFCSGENNPNPLQPHTNFKISSDGETLILSDPNGNFIDSTEAVNLSPDESFGRLPDGGSELGKLTRPTPGASNNSEQLTKPILCSADAGFYDEPFELLLQSADSIFYTLDGSDPSIEADLYEGSIHLEAETGNPLSLIPTNHLIEGAPWESDQYGFIVPEFNIEKSIPLKARSFSNGVATSPLYSGTYFTRGKNYSLPVVSLITDSVHLFANSSGIYVPGVHFDTLNPDWTGNYFQRGEEWEKPAHIEYFSANGERQFSENIGIRISGNGSRSVPQKSLRLLFRDQYGSSHLEYPLFSQIAGTKHKRLLLRSSFAFWWWSGQANPLFLDDILHEIANRGQFNLDPQNTQPSILFLNGEYWGIQSLRQSNDRFFLSEKFEVDRDSIDIANGATLEVEQGNCQPLIDILEYVQNNDLTQDHHYLEVASQIDLINYIDYFIFETYFGNVDWPVNNVMVYKLQRPGSKWRWLLYDLDRSMYSITSDPFVFLEQEPANPQVKLFSKLMENQEFSTLFLDRYKRHLSNGLKPSRVSQILNTFIDKYSPEVDEHARRWSSPKTYEDWYGACLYFKQFAEERPCHIVEHLKARFPSRSLDDFDCGFSNEEPSFSMYPNPTIESVTIVLNQLQLVGGNLSLYNVYGKRVFEEKVSRLKQRFQIDALPAGTYLVVVSNEKSRVSKKLLIQ